MAVSARWCFTLNNYTDQHVLHLQRLTTSDGVKFLIFGRETGENGTPHLQGYIEFNSPKRLKGASTVLGARNFHLEKARGNAAQSIDYCSKQDPSPYQYGEPGRQGARNDLLELKADIDSGKSLTYIRDNHFSAFIRYSRGIMLAASLGHPPRNHRTQCVYLWGPTGSGKTRFAARDSQNLCPNSVCWLPDVSLKWFDGYNPSDKGVVLDDFDGSASLPLLLRLIDRYPMKVPIKGGFVEWRPRIVWITSNYPLDHWYSESHEHYRALLRRIDEIQHML